MTISYDVQRKLLLTKGKPTPLYLLDINGVKTELSKVASINVPDLRHSSRFRLVIDTDIMTNLNILDTTPNRSEFTHALQFASKQQAMTFYKETNKELSC